MKDALIAMRAGAAKEGWHKASGEKLEAYQLADKALNAKVSTKKKGK